VSKQIGIGVVGFGWMGQAHSRSYRRIPMYFADEELEPRLVIVADNVPARTELGRGNFGFEETTADWRAVVNHPEVDVVDITAPNTLHHQVAAAAAAAGKAIFCEKPVGERPDVTAAIEAVARHAGVITGVGFNYRWAPLVQYLKTLIDDGRFGGLTHYRGRFFSMYGRDRLGRLSWRYLLDEAGYGALTDLMSHAVDMALFLVGPISRVVATKEIFVRQRPLPHPGEGTHYDRGSATDPTGEVTNEDYVGALVEFANGARGTLEADRSIFGPQSQMALELNGHRGAASWNLETMNEMQLYLPEETPADGYVRVLSGDAFPRHGHIVPGGGNSIGYEDLKVFEALEFLKSVAAEEPATPGFADALAAAEVEAAMARSWESGGWEDVTSLRAD
jgi:predicted dehydrogenase